MALAIVLVIMGIVTGLAIAVIDVYGEMKATSALRSDGLMALEQMCADVREAREVRPVPGGIIIIRPDGPTVIYGREPRTGGIRRSVVLRAGRRGNCLTGEDVHVRELTAVERGRLVDIAVVLERPHPRTGRPITVELSTAARMRN